MRYATIRQMQVFEAVARHMSFSRAAEELHLSQPAVSLQIKQLEGLAGLPLFEQLKRRLYLTAAGETLLGHFRAVLAAVADAEAAMAAMRGRRAGGLRLAVVSTAKYFAPPLLSAFLAGYPGVDLSLAIANREQVLAQLAANEVDLAIMGRPPTDFPVQSVPFAKHPMVMIAPPDHPLARRKARMADLGGETFLVREQGSGTRILMEGLLASHSVVPGHTIEMASNESIKQAVMAGMGVSLLSRHTIGLELSVGRLAVLDLQGLPIQRDWYVVTREGKQLLPVAAAFVRFLQEEGAARIEAATRAGPPSRRRSRHK
ncbi:MAG: LysR family transcriptional regulator [Magnetospirillum sp.]|nr:LysR family transcriptional regulator [Magnetospirillum sp.]